MDQQLRKKKRKLGKSVLSRQVLTRHLQNVTGAIAWTSEMSAVRPAPEQILVPVFQTSVSHVLERAHYFLAAQKRILQRKHPIRRGPGTRRDPCPLRGLAVTGRRARRKILPTMWFTLLFCGFQTVAYTQSSKPHHSSTIQLAFPPRPLRARWALLEQR